MGQCASNKSKQNLVSKKKCKHPFLIIPYSRKELKKDKPTISCGVATSFGFKRRVGSAPSDNIIRPFGEVDNMSDKKEIERTSRVENSTLNKFGFRSRSVSRTGSSISSTNDNNKNNLLFTNPNRTTTTVDGNKNIVNNINYNLQTKMLPSALKKPVSYKSNLDSKPNTNKLQFSNSHNATESKMRVPNNVNVKGNINRSGLPTMTSTTSGVKTTTTSGIPTGRYVYQSSQRNPTNRLVTNGSYLPTDKSVKQDINIRMKSQTSMPSRLNNYNNNNNTLRLRQQMLGVKSPNARKLEMVQSNDSKYKFELKEVEVTQVVPLKDERKKKPVSSGKTVYETLCRPTPKLGIKPIPSTKPLRPLSSLMSSSSDESDESERDPPSVESDVDKNTLDNLPKDSQEMFNEFEEMEGSGDAMAMNFEDEEECVDNVEKLSPESSLDVKTDLRSMLLKIEDPSFAVLAAMSTNDRLEDENAPESPPTSESADLCSPTNKKTDVQYQSCPNNESGNNVDRKSVPELDSPGTPTNMSFSEGEADGRGHDDFLIDDEIADQPGLVFDEDQGNTSSVTLHNKLLKKCVMNDANSPQCASPTRSMGTLSPCESIRSEDLMMDFELSDAELTRLTEADSTWDGDNTFIKTPITVKKMNSCTNCSEQTAYAEVDEEDSVCTDSGYSIQPIEEDLASIKSDLVLLQNILSRDHRHGGRNVNNNIAGEDSEMVQDLKRQVLLLKQQLIEKDRITSLLQEELNIYINKKNDRETVVSRMNAATQTERIRLASLGYNSEGSGSLISSNEEIVETHT